MKQQVRDNQQKNKEQIKERKKHKYQEQKQKILAQASQPLFTVLVGAPLSVSSAKSRSL